MHQTLEHSEHAEHAAHDGNKRAALLVAILAALLAVSEQGAKHAEIRLEESSIGAADHWAQYQAKSIRSTMAKDLADVAATLTPQAAGSVAAHDDVIKHLRDDATRYEHGSDGKDAIAAEAKKLEGERDHALEQTHTYDNAAAALELGIVLATASAITSSTPLLMAAAGLGVAGSIFALLGVFAPTLGAF